jgi:3'(2'),5'-bisphosphate nucleotidase
MSQAVAHPSIETLIAIAVAAGAAILPFYAAGTGSEARRKDDGSPVTAADEAAEAVILKALAELGITAVIAEEAAAAGRIPDVDGDFYLVDPLDGTKEFVTGSGEFTVNIARVRAHRAVAGVVYAPATGALYAGEHTVGADRAVRATVTGGVVGPHEPIRVARPTHTLRVVASKSHLNDETKAFIDRYPVETFVSSGSSLKFCRIAEGAADLYPRLGRTMEWDTAAGHAVVEAAGGKVLTMDGAELLYGKTGARSGGDPFGNPHFVACGAFDPFAASPAATSPAI